MKNIILIFFLFLITANCFSASDKIYSWTDEDGVRHFSDTPTYSVEQESKGTEPFPIDRHGSKQIINPQKIIGFEVLKKLSENQVEVQQTKQKFKSGGGHLNLNIIELFVSSLLPVVVPFFLIILVFLLLKLAVLFFLKGSKSRKNKYQPVKSKKENSVADWNRPDINSPEFKGFQGEQIIIDLLYRFLDRGKYHFFNDLILPEKEGTTQIDHLIVSEYGIFIIETKNMKGLIFGNPSQKFWTQWLTNGKYPFQNPFRQNYKHKKCLEGLLKIESDVYFEAVVFIEGANFPKGQPDRVFYPKEFIQFVKSQTKKVLLDNEIDMVLSVIDASRLEPSFETDKRHKAYVKSLIAGK
jgi:hypothetical protein